MDEKEKAYRWLCLSDTASMHMGPPDFPETEIPDREQFEADFEDFYFLESGQDRGSVMIIEKDGEEIGCLCYACFHLKGRSAELDIWLRERKLCGNGFGSAALKELVRYLEKEKGIRRFIIRPSEKNTRAIRAYEKAGFRRVEDKMETVRDYLLEEYLEEYGSGDYGYENTAVLVKR